MSGARVPFGPGERLTVTRPPSQDLVGRLVVYRPFPGGPPEQGEVTSVNKRFVFVRYGADTHSKSTRPEDLEIVG